MSDGPATDAAGFAAGCGAATAGDAKVAAVRASAPATAVAATTRERAVGAGEVLASERPEEAALGVDRSFMKASLLFGPGWGSRDLFGLLQDTGVTSVYARVRTKLASRRLLRWTADSGPVDTRPGVDGRLHGRRAITRSPRPSAETT
ncbi:hypothetical protein CCE02nite_15000 [Cellulosimicrobium cellulans]|uniref:Uncharacterized protein n=1 Tax=Cellulosimicrobium cellulans TaxID=1710 RepID=A0A4Y4E485_CELCE|nr:hypothetical protein CCE02nite_15000 [Cellulosimicrobium cellulans]